MGFLKDNLITMATLLGVIAGKYLKHMVLIDKNNKLLN